MKKRLQILGMAGLLSIGLSMTALAGEWEQDSTGWRWQNDDGTNPVSCWQWLDGNNDGISECYYFNQDGYMLANTTTPDGYQVDADGAWTVDNVVQTQSEKGEGNTADANAQKVHIDPSLNPNSYTLKTDFVKKEFVNLLHMDVETMFRVMGKEEKPVNFLGAYDDYYYSMGSGVIVFSVKDGIIFKVSAFLDYSVLMNFTKDTYTYQELDQLFGTVGYQNTLGNRAWKISDEYPIYAQLEKNCASITFPISE